MLLKHFYYLLFRTLALTAADILNIPGHVMFSHAYLSIAKIFSNVDKIKLVFLVYMLVVIFY